MAMIASRLICMAALASAMQTNTKIGIRLSKDELQDNAWTDTYWQVLENLGDAQYTGIIKVGGQELNAVIDTGSFELVVFGVNCTSCGSVGNLYNGLKSKSFNKGWFPMEQTYGSGTTYSLDATDVVSVGDKLSVKKQLFWNVYDADMAILSKDTFAAILGVGPPGSGLKFAKADKESVHKELEDYKKRGETITPKMWKVVKHYDDAVDHEEAATTFVDNLGVGDMSACMGRQSGSKGYHIWNDFAKMHSPELFQKLDVVGDIYWSAEMTDVHTGEGFVPKGASKDRKNAAEPAKLACYDGRCSAVIDTGTSLIIAPSTVVQRVHEVVDNWAKAGGTCDDLSKLPDFNFKLNGKSFLLPPESYIGTYMGELREDVKHFFPSLARMEQAKASQGWSNCQPLILSMDADSQFGPLWILGMPFFRKYYTTFSFEKNEWGSLTAKSMSLSIADDHCKPSKSPEEEADNKWKSLGQQRSNDPRPAQLNVDLSKVRLPRLANNVMAQIRSFSRIQGANGTRPYVHI